MPRACMWTCVTVFVGPATETAEYIGLFYLLCWTAAMTVPCHYTLKCPWLRDFPLCIVNTSPVAGRGLSAGGTAWLLQGCGHSCVC